MSQAIPNTSSASAHTTPPAGEPAEAPPYAKTSTPEEIEQEKQEYLSFLASCNQDMRNDSNMEEGPRHTEPWRNTHELVEKHDNGLCADWANDIDTLLTFTGLFSAVVTAFVIESYQWLDYDNGDASLQILLRISAQLANPNISSAALPDEASFKPTPSQLRINIFWFLSLSVALMTALIGILCKQWLREYQKDASLPYKDMLSVRQMRLEAFKFWKVEDILSYLPLLLQIALLFFFAGMLDLLWHKDHLLAIVVTIFVAAGYSILIGTTLLPGVLYLVYPSVQSIPPCAFKSPQSWLFLRSIAVIERTVSLFLPSSKSPAVEKETPLETWLHLERKQITKDINEVYLSRAVQWVDENYSQNLGVVMDIAQCIDSMQPVYLGWVFGSKYSRVLETTDDPPSIVRDLVQCQYLVDHQAKFDVPTELEWTQLFIRLQSIIQSDDLALQKYVAEVFSSTIVRTHAYMPRILKTYFSMIHDSYDSVPKACTSIAPFLRSALGSLALALRKGAVHAWPDELLWSKEAQASAAPDTEHAMVFIMAVDALVEVVLTPKSKRRRREAGPSPHMIMWYILTKCFMPVMHSTSEFDGTIIITDWPHLTYPSLDILIQQAIRCNTTKVLVELAKLIAKLESHRVYMQIDHSSLRDWHTIVQSTHALINLL